jgi:hypothetical protein
MNPENFLLGFGERLVESMAPPPSKLTKNAPYTIDEAIDRLTPQFQETSAKLDRLPNTANPNGKSVVAITLHPSYVAKSYYPTSLFSELSLTPIGSKETKIKPSKWTRQEPPKEVRSTMIYVEGDLSTFQTINQKISQLDQSSTAANDIVKIEKVEPIPESSKIKDIPDDTNEITIEIALHLGGPSSRDEVLTGFKDHLDFLGINASLDDRLELDGICFLPVTAKGSDAKGLAQYSFLRYARKMPYMLPIIRSTDGLSFDAILPPESPVDPGMRVAIFDGGIPEVTAIEPWIRRFDADGVGVEDADLLKHGTAVTGAALFGPLRQGTNAQTPYCYIDHYRVLDGDNQTDELTVIKRIRDVIEGNNYKYINISLGPPIPITDDDINPWTVILDRLIFRNGILATVACGNDGDLDEASGNARIQPPCDAVNALGVGATNIITGQDWARADYSSYGPGRAPGVIKPEVLAFGGSSREPFYVIDAANGETVAPTTGTSFSSPTVLRTALGIRAHFGEVLSPVALKALLVHSADKDDNTHETKHCGWGKVPVDFKEIVATDDATVRIVYQGTLNPAEWMNVPVPMPSGTLAGMVTIKASLCYFTDTNPEDPVNYTKSGMEIRFRPHKDKRDKSDQMYPNSSSFFQKNQINLFDDELNHNAHFWETTLSASKRMRASSLNEPVFNLHYNARSSGARAGTDTPPLNYAMVITISAPRNATLYSDTLQRYRTRLEALQPVVQIPVRVS